MSGEFEGRIDEVEEERMGKVRRGGMGQDGTEITGLRALREWCSLGGVARDDGYLRPNQS